MNWFGKNCHDQINQWEENERINPNYKENTPILTFCNHKMNPEDTEGNCRKAICPIIWSKS